MIFVKECDARCKAHPQWDFELNPFPSPWLRELDLTRSLSNPISPRVGMIMASTETRVAWWSVLCSRPCARRVIAERPARRDGRARAFVEEQSGAEIRVTGRLRSSICRARRARHKNGASHGIKPLEMAGIASRM